MRYEEDIFIAVFVACLLASCLEDKGNDLYIELNDVTIGKIRDTTVEQFTRLKIEPEITTRSGEFKAEDYTYLWYMYTTYGMSSLTSADTLSLEKIWIRRSLVSRVTIVWYLK